MTSDGSGRPMPPTEKSETNTPQRPPHLWKPGQSGNPAGKPKGVLHKTTQAVMEMMQGESDAIARVAIDKAKAGDITALKLVLDRIAPPVKGRAIKMDLPSINTLNDILKAQTAVAEAMSEGDITPDEAATVASILEIKRRALETLELEKRIEALEKELKP